MAFNDKTCVPSVGILSTCDNIDPPRWWSEMNERQKNRILIKYVRLSDFDRVSRIAIKLVNNAFE